MDYLVLSLISFIFVFTLLLVWTRKKEIKRNRQIVLLFLIVILIVILGFAINDIFVSDKSKLKVKGKSIEQFGGGIKKRNKLMNICGMPKKYGPTGHCFNDGTHHTCCMLGPEARKYADSSGNPIGKAAKKAFKFHKNRAAKKNELTPWCTCFGSEVCSFYAKKFNDGTHIKFVNNPKSSTDAAFNPSPNCEGYFRQKFDVSSHGTPGINSVSGVDNSCSSELNKIKSVYNETQM